jgi:hypothetical protein
MRRRLFVSHKNVPKIRFSMQSVIEWKDGTARVSKKHFYTMFQ